MDSAHVHVLVDGGLLDEEVEEGEGGCEFGREGHEGEEGVGDEEDHYVLYHWDMGL